MKRLIFIGLSILLLASCGEPTINGKLVDNFNNPIKDAKVEIEGTAFTTTTNSKGEYEINFVPGAIKLKYTKKNYLDTVLRVNVSTKDNFPAQIVKTYKLPSNGEINYISKEQYIPLNNAPIKIDKTFDTRYIKEGYYNHDTKFKTVTYYTNKDEVVKIKKSEIIQFIDTLPDAITLVKLQETTKGLKILSTEVPYSYEYSRYSGGTGIVYLKDIDYKCWERTYYLNNQFLYYTYVKVEGADLNNQNQGRIFYLRTYKNLEVGYYAFCFDLKKNVKKPLNTKYAMVFKVE